MAHRRTRSRGISQTQRRKKTWLQLRTVIGVGDQTPGFQTSFGLGVDTPGSFGSSDRDGFFAATGDGTGAAPFQSSLPEESTILRVRGSLQFPKTEVTGGGGTFGIANQAAFGFGVAPLTDNFNSSYPGPITDADWDGWMFLRQSTLPPVEANSGIVDVKAMRKLRSGDTFFVMAEGLQIAATTVPFEWAFDLRLLILLP